MAKIQETIVFSDRFSAYRDNYGWTLVEKQDSLNKKKELVIVDFKTYHSILKQICFAINAQDVIDQIDKSKHELLDRK